MQCLVLLNGSQHDVVSPSYLSVVKSYAVAILCASELLFTGYFPIYYVAVSLLWGFIILVN